MYDAGIMAAIAGSIAAFAVIVLVWYVLLVIAQWKIFTKAGEAGWKSIIPFLNTYVLFKISWKPLWFWITLILAVVFAILSSFAADSVLALVLLYIVDIAVAVIGIIQYVKLSKAYGHGAGFALGLIILNPIFMLILGLGSSQYVGKSRN